MDKANLFCRQEEENTSLSLQKKQKKIKAIATLLEILEGNLFHFGNEEAK